MKLNKVVGNNEILFNIIILRITTLIEIKGWNYVPIIINADYGLVRLTNFRLCYYIIFFAMFGSSKFVKLSIT